MNSEADCLDAAGGLVCYISTYLHMCVCMRVCVLQMRTKGQNAPTRSFEGVISLLLHPPCSVANLECLVRSTKMPESTKSLYFEWVWRFRLINVWTPAGRCHFPLPCLQGWKLTRTLFLNARVDGGHTALAPWGLRSTSDVSLAKSCQCGCHLWTN